VEITGITIKILTIDLSVTLAGGAEATAEDVRIALASPLEGPDADTVWVEPYSYDPGTQQVEALICGHLVEDVPPRGLKTPPAGAMLYGRVVDNPEDDPAPLELIEVGRG
jgi:hypothetical protein